MLSLPQHGAIFKPQSPRAKVLDVRDSVSDLTTYTFTAVNIPEIGTTMSEVEAYGAGPMLRTPSRKIIYVIVHSEDAAVTWTASTCTLGGISSSKVVDRGGASTIIDTAIFRFGALTAADPLPNTDIVVTFSEAITACAIGVVLVENVAIVNTIAVDSGATSGVDNVNPATNFVNADTNNFMLLGTTHTLGNLTETVQTEAYGSAGGFQPQLLYESSNAEMSYAAYFSTCPQWNGANGFVLGTTTSWSGASGFDNAGFVGT